MFEPAHEAHAIDKVSVSVSFGSFVMGAPWIKVLFAAAAFAEDQGLDNIVDPVLHPGMPSAPSGVSFV